jgi:hypothetical protein
VTFLWKISAKYKSAESFTEIMIYVTSSKSDKLGAHRIHFR